MERIKIHNTAALDRMATMQQRYHQHQEIMGSNMELNRRISSASQFEETNVSVHSWRIDSPIKWNNKL